MFGPKSLAILLFCAGAASAENIRISIYHTNDIHGWIMPRPAGKIGADPHRQIGGFAAYASWVRHDKGPKLVLDAGDWFQGTPEGMLSRGEAVVDSFNALGLDAVEIGNHDLDLGQARLAELSRKIHAPVLAANLYDAKTGRRPAFVRPHVIKEVAGVKIGIFGLITAMRRNYIERNIEGLRLAREVDEAKAQVRELQREGATVIVALCHVGIEEPPNLVFEGERLIASQVPGIDVIVGGHTHAATERPILDPQNGTLINDTGLFLTHGGKITIEIDPKTKRVVHSDGMLQPLWIDELGQAPDEVEISDHYRKQVGAALDAPIGTSAATLGRENWEESALGDWVADCMRQTAGVDIAFQNSPSLRADLPQGAVSLRRIYEMMPFDNYIATTTLTGAQVRQVLEYAVSGKTNIIQVSGLSFRYKTDAPAGKRVTAVEIGGHTLEDSGRYLVATNDFLIRGGDGYTAFTEGQGSSVGTRLARDAFADCVRHQTPVQPPKPGRIFRE